MKEEVLDERIVRDICSSVQETLLAEGNMERVSSPVTLVGDIHGQFYDVLKMMSLGRASLS